MFGIKFYKDENVPFVAGSEIIMTNLSSSQDFELKRECFNTWKSSINEFDIVKIDNYSHDDIEEDKEEDVEEDVGEEDNEDAEKLNENDEDEDVSDKLYIISLNDVPYYYEDDLDSARKTMWNLAKNMLYKNSLENDDYESTSYIFTNNLNNLSIITPYNFLFFYYHQTLCDVKIDYVTKHKYQT